MPLLLVQDGANYRRMVQVSERTCDVCGCDIDALHPNRKTCLAVACAKDIKRRDRARRAGRNRKPSDIRNGAEYSTRALSGRYGAYMPVVHVLQKGKIQTGHGGTNVDRAALADARREEWRRLTGGRKIEQMTAAPDGTTPVRAKSWKESNAVHYAALKRKGVGK
jgi:hypothetical protein